jgi:hypothetical protein
VQYALLGNEHGWTWFFSQQQGSGYFRPAKHMVAWLVGSAFPEHRALAYRLLHFTVFAGYIVVLGLWIRWLGLTLGGAIVASLIFLLHPALPATLSSIDGFGGLTATVLMWLGTLLAIRFRESTAAVASVGAICFAIGGLFKEYIGALILLIGTTILMFRARARLASFIIVMIVLSIAFAGYMAARRYTMPGGEDQGSSFVAKTPRQLATNVALAGAGTFFPGNSIWVYLRRDALAFGVAGAASAAVFLVLLWGVRAAFRRAMTTPRGTMREPRFTDPRVVRFLVIALALATFPCILHRKHFAEKYIAPMLLPLALLGGVAREQYRRSKRGTQLIAGAVAAGATVSSIAAVLDKNHGIRDAGERAEHIARQILAQVDDPAAPATLECAFLNSEMQHQPEYSVYVIPDFTLLSPGSYSFEWWQPGSKIRYQLKQVDSLEQAGRSEADYVFVWDAAGKRARRIR